MQSSSQIGAMLGTNAIARNDVHDHASKDAELDEGVRVEANAVSE